METDPDLQVLAKHQQEELFTRLNQCEVNPNNYLVALANPTNWRWAHIPLTQFHPDEQMLGAIELFIKPTLYLEEHLDQCFSQANGGAEVRFVVLDLNNSLALPLRFIVQPDAKFAGTPIGQNIFSNRLHQDFKPNAYVISFRFADYDVPDHFELSLPTNSSSLLAKPISPSLL